MTLYPEVQSKAQAEIDAVVGLDRLPTIQDREQLPYVNALTVELLRWFAIAPLGMTPSFTVVNDWRRVANLHFCQPGITHVTTEDDVYEGYFIPKGSYIFPNMWSVDIRVNSVISGST
jgi:cytochrome P450